VGIGTAGFDGRGGPDAFTCVDEFFVRTAAACALIDGAKVSVLGRVGGIGVPEDAGVGHGAAGGGDEVETLVGTKWWCAIFSQSAESGLAYECGKVWDRRLDCAGCFWGLGSGPGLG
jgi:hypothetical protein